MTSVRPFRRAARTTVRARTAAARCALFAIVVGLVGLPARARGGEGSASPLSHLAHLAHLADLEEQVAAAKGPFAYVALRRVWSEWDRGDPAAVEEALRHAATDESQAWPVRVYAGLLQAYARRRRGDLDGARAQIARLGFVAKWMMLGPFDNDGKAGWATAFEPEAEQDQPFNLTHDYDGKDHRPARWRLLPALSPYGWVDFGAFLRPTENACVYGATFVRDRALRGAATRPVSVWAGATGALRLFWNGAGVFDDPKYRDFDSDRFAIGVTLHAGWNRLTAKVCGDERAPMLSLRVASLGGAPDDHIEVDADPRHSTRQDGAVEGVAAHATKPGQGGGPGERPLAGVEGPIQAFERLVRTEDPAVLEGFARYLEATGADDPTEHRARELARKAAEKAPTIPRLLLAGAVAESRNQRAVWLERAEALAARRAGREEWLQVLLARADYAREGVNGRDAVPDYERVLALDPDNVPATLAKVDLYEDGGLRDTALTLLQRALDRRPRSVGLLRAMVGALRAEGREIEADEVADRYSALRFDDPAVVRSRIEVALARRDATAAAKWIDRLLATNPDSVAALETAAQSWTRLGDRARAIAAYRTALEIAPNDTDAMRQLATLYGVSGERDEQLRLLRRVLELLPQATDVRDEVAHIGPPTPRPDERFARPASEFLARRTSAAAGNARRSLVDLQVTTVFANGLASRFHQVVFQPLTDAAAARSREYEFTYETDSQTVQLRAARVYRANGHIDEAVDSGAGAMADDPDLAIYTTTRSYYVRFPRLEPGDVVELQYRVEDVAPRNAFADYFGEVVYLQGSEPMGRAEYVLLAPKSRALYFNEPRVPGLVHTVEDHGEQRMFRFVALDVAPVEPEPLQPPWTEILGHVNVSTYKTWDDLGRWYWGLVRDQFVPDDEVRTRAEALTHGLKDDAAKARAIYDYVVQKTRYVGLEFGIHGYKPYRCAEIFARGFGDCKDKATLIVTMLNALGIKTIPVVVRTGNKGDIETAPASLAPFDHMIAYVPSLDRYLDGTAEFTGSLELPAMDRGALAMQVSADGARLVHLPDPPAIASVVSHVVDATVAAGGDAQLEWRANISGVDAAEWRARFHAESTRKARMQQMFGAILPGSEVAVVDAGDLEDVERPVSVRVRGRVPHFARPEGDAITIPLGRREHMVRDYAPLPARKHDVRLYAQWTEDDDWTIRLPAGAAVRALPTAVRGTSPFGLFSLDARAEGSVLHVRTTIQLVRTRIAATEYPAFRAWCEEVDRALGQRATVEMH